MSQNILFTKTIIIFFLLHFLLYPASNGYNSYMDRDEGSIGDIEKPPAATRQLFITTLVMDIAGSILAFLVSPLFAILYMIYIFFSRLYSYRGIRLKKYPFIGYLTVVLNQGALIFYMVYSGAGKNTGTTVWTGMLISILLIGAFYPITQIYQHAQDRKDGVTTISYKLGVKGTFIYCGCLYTIAFSLLGIYYYNTGHFNYFLILQAWFLPVIARFLWWTVQCWKDIKYANFRNTMRMNWLAATCTNLAFITLIIMKYYG
jgi:1,4-dihydroxy-2-naphthoate octaprenyltransferase